MRTFKTIDAWISLGLIIAFTFLVIFTDKGFGLPGNMLFTGYFVVGGWQVISMLVHVYYHSFTKKGSIRNIYHWITFVSLITMPAGSFWILYFAAPFMAVFYNCLCFAEVRKMNQRPLAILK